MANVEDSSDNSLWDASVCRKSWAEMVEEEFDDSKEILPKKLERTPNKSSFNFQRPVTRRGSPKTIVEEGEEANSGKNSPLSSVSTVDSLPTFGKSLAANGQKTPVKKETELPQEDISLTGHLDVKLGLASPAKTDTGSRRRVWTMKPSQPTTASPSKLVKRKAPANNGLKSEIDKQLMPSPSKILKTTPKKETTLSAVGSPIVHEMLTRKRVREMLSSKPGRDGKRREKREPETDPEVLARRQRQIDYGKNTLGYEKYRQLVPKEEREKVHPKTPPIGIKFSRRAWDGLVRVWRQRLHFWDDPSEGGGNPETLELPSDISDCSSIDGSQPNTPVQDTKRKRSGRFVHTNTPRPALYSCPPGVPEDDDEGCTPFQND